MKTTLPQDSAPGADQPPADDPLSKLADKVDGSTQQEILDALPPEPEPIGLPPEMLAGIAKIPFMLLKAVRANIAKRLPEIMDEWTDDVLQVPADAVPPLVVKYAARVAPMLGAYPEEAALVLSTLPLCLGYFAATSRHEATKPVQMEVWAAPAPQSSETAAAPTEKPQGFVGVHSGAEV